MRTFIKAYPFLVLAFLVVMTGCESPKPHRRRRHVDPQAELAASTMARDREAVTHALETAVGDDEEGLRLLAFYRARAHFVYLGADGTYAFERGTDPFHVGIGDGAVQTDILIAPAPIELRARFGLQPGTNFEYDQQRTTLFVPPTSTYTTLWLGIRTAHEVRHAFDHLTGVEQIISGAAGEREFAMGEVRAHSLEIRLLDRATGGGFTRELRRVLDDLVPPDAGPIDWVMPNFPGDMIDVYRLFPPALSEEEESTRNGSCLIAINFLFAERRGPSFDARVEAYLRWRAVRQYIQH